MSEDGKRRTVADGDFDSLTSLASVGSSEDLGDGSEDVLVRALEPGTYVGRYMILDQLGRGGMGVVYKAYDPQLDRRIALKLLSVRRKSDSRAKQARERLLRESQALAQLSHPNVVSAFDVGTIDEDVFVAMELVEGKTFKQWRRDKPRSVRDVVEVLTAAGKGIAAAHRAGLIHRDIKPDNIIIGNDGRVRVLDFGLARAVMTGDSDSKEDESKEEEMAEEERLCDLESSPNLETISGTVSLRSSMTLDGAVMGTPGYMAPEQYFGWDQDEHTDQYSFSVNLFEGLYGKKPFHALNMGELKRKVINGKLDSPPDAKVPKRLLRIITKGMAVAKEDRYPSVEALLHELSKDPRVMKRRIALTVAAVVLLVAGVGVSSAWQESKQKMCRGAEKRLAGVWDLGRRANVRDTFVGTGRPYALDTYQRVERLLDRRANAWVTMRTEACEATRVRGEQSEQLLDLRMRCLDRRLAEMDALTELLARERDGEVMDKAVAAVYGLSDLLQCADAEALTAKYPPPQGTQFEEVRRLRGGLAEAIALYQAGKVREGLAIVLAAGKEAARIDYPPLRAELEFWSGRLYSSLHNVSAAEASLHRAIEAAAEARDDRMRAQATIALARVVGYQRALYDHGMEIGRLAKADVMRAGQDPVLRSRLLEQLGIILSRQGKFDEAHRHLSLALEIGKDAPGVGQLDAASILNKLANVQVEQGHYEEARQTHERSLVILKKALGPDHPRVALSLHTIGRVLFHLNRFAEAKETMLQSIAVFEGAFGPDYYYISNTLINLGKCLDKLGLYQESRQAFERALVIGEKVYSIDHPKLGYALHGMGELLKSQGLCREALPYYRRALVVWQKAHGKDHILVAHPMTGLGTCLVEVKRFGPAVKILEQALAIRIAKPRDAHDTAETRFALARALLAGGKDRRRAFRLAEKAREVYAIAGESKQAEFDTVLAWLHRHR